MTGEITLDNVERALVDLLHLVYALDFAMWLEQELEGTLDATPVSMYGEHARRAAVEEYLREHRRELLSRTWICKRCGFEYAIQPQPTTCPARHIPWHRIAEGLSHDQVVALPEEICAGELEEHVHDVGEPALRERAGFAVARTDSRARGPYWLGPSSPEDNLEPAKLVAERLQTCMREGLDRITHALGHFTDPLHLAGRRDLLPRGDAVHEQYEDYVSLRDRVLTCYHRLTGLQQDDREYLEFDRWTGPRRFPPPVTLVYTTPNPLDDLVELGQAAALVSKSKRTLEKALARGDLPKPDVVGGGGKPHRWNWSNLRPHLERLYRPGLPKRFPRIH